MIFRIDVVNIAESPPEFIPLEKQGRMLLYLRLLIIHFRILSLPLPKLSARKRKKKLYGINAWIWLEIGCWRSFLIICANNISSFRAGFIWFKTKKTSVMLRFYKVWINGTFLLRIFDLNFISEIVKRVHTYFPEGKFYERIPPHLPSTANGGNK